MKNQPLSPNIVPINGGNAYSTYEYLKAMENSSSQLYMLYIHQQDYFTSLYKVDGDDHIKAVWKNILYFTWNYGQCGVRVINGKYVIFGLTDLEFDEELEIESATGIIASGIQGFYKDQKKVKLTKENTAFFRWETGRWPAWFRWRKYLEEFLNYLNGVKTNAVWNVKKMVYQQSNNNSATGQEEKKSVLDFSTPYITEVQLPNLFGKKGDDLASPNKWVEIKTGVNQSTDIWGSFHNYEEWVNMKNGRRGEINQKKERKITDEVNSGNYNFDILESQPMEYLQQGANKLGELAGITLKVYKVVEDMTDGVEDEDEDGETGDGDNKDKEI